METHYEYTANGLLHKETLSHDATTPDTATTYDYSGTYQGAVPTTITDALNHVTTLTYDQNTLALVSLSDANGVTGYSYRASDGRLDHIDKPIGYTSYAYPSTTEVDETTRLTDSDSLHQASSVTTSTIYDGLGRRRQTAQSGACSG